MPKWYKPLFPDAQSDDDLVLLYSFNTVLGDWELHTPVKTFRSQLLKQVNEFYLFWNCGEDSVACMNSVFDAINAVAQHKSSVKEWDHSSSKASDYLDDWKREISDRVILTSSTTGWNATRGSLSGKWSIISSMTTRT